MAHVEPAYNRAPRIQGWSRLEVSQPFCQLPRDAAAASAKRPSDESAPAPNPNVILSPGPGGFPGHVHNMKGAYSPHCWVESWRRREEDCSGSAEDLGRAADALRSQTGGGLFV